MHQDVLLIGDNQLIRRILVLLERADHGVSQAAADLPAGAFTTIVVATDDDDQNLNLALAALELHPGVRLVVRIDSQALARGLQERLPAAIILCPPELAASSFAAATVHPSLQGAMMLQDRLYALWETTAPPEGAQILIDDVVGYHLVLAPWDQVREWLAAAPAASEPAVPFRPGGPAGFGLARSWRMDAVVGFAMLILASLLTFGTVFFAHVKGLSLIDAFYFTATTIATVGYGDISLHDASVGPKLVGVGLMFAGVMSLAVMTALVTDQVFRRRQAMLRGHRRSRLRGHVVLCGLGRLGAGILTMLDLMGEKVVAIEPAPDPVIANAIQQGGIHLIEADATHPESLEFANLRQARALVAATDNDLANIQIALTAVSLHPAIRLVLRIFTPELARRSQAFLGFGRSLNAWRLAAEAFVAAILEDDRVCLVAEWRGKTIELVHQANGRVTVRGD
jgi:Trk K+ transport system NAD-binding subunit